MPWDYKVFVFDDMFRYLHRFNKNAVQVTDIHASLFSILGYALLLGLMMFKSGTVAKSIMNTH